MQKSKILLTLLSGVIPFTFAMSEDIKSPENVVGFFQSYDSPSPETWYFNNPGESLANSGYSILVDGFWINYPFCWGDGSGIPGQGSPIPVCKGIVNQPGPGLSTEIYHKFWDNYSGAMGPSTPGEEYNDYWTSVHNGGPSVISKLRKEIDKIGDNNITHKKIKLLASIGGWNMGGSAAGVPIVPTAPIKPGWAALLKDPDQFAKVLGEIYNVKIDGVKIYDGISINIETPYGLGCAGSTCTNTDKEAAVDAMVSTIEKFKKTYPDAILSTPPRAADLACDQKNCSWNNTDGVGFMGEILEKLAAKGIYFDYINPQFYNDVAARNIPSSLANNEVHYGDQVVSILKKIHDMNIIGPNTQFTIGVLSQTNSGDTDTGGASKDGNPGISKELLPKLWDLLQTDPEIKSTGVKIDGIMTWAVNLAMNGSGVGGNVRTISSNTADVVPYNWPSDLWSETPPIDKPSIIWTSKGFPAQADLTSGTFTADAILKNAPEGDSLVYTCHDITTTSASCEITSLDTSANGSFDLNGAAKGDSIVITASDSSKLAQSVQSNPIIADGQPTPSTYNVTLASDGKLAGYYYKVTPGDKPFTSGGWINIPLGNIDFSKSAVVIKAWNHYWDDTTNVTCPKPTENTDNIKYIISGSLNKAQCSIQTG